MNACVEMVYSSPHQPHPGTHLVRIAGDGRIEMVSDSQTGGESRGRKYLQDLRTEKVKQLEDKELVQWLRGKAPG